MRWLRRTPIATLLKVVLYTLVGLLLLSYALFQARSLITGPALTLDELAVVHTEPTVTITGTAHNISSLTLNDRPIYTDETGRFNELVVLEQGYTIMTLWAQDRYGREDTLSHPLVYAPAYTEIR